MDKRLIKQKGGVEKVREKKSWDRFFKLLFKNNVTDASASATQKPAGYSDSINSLLAPNDDEEEEEEERVWTDEVQADSSGEQRQEEEAAVEDQRRDNHPAGDTASASSCANDIYCLVYML